jgi:hypothetical protein
MATDPTNPVQSASHDNAVVAPLAGTRSQAMQRLQIGLFGLAAMVLLVGLANIIITNAERNQARVVPEAAPTVTAEQNAAPGTDPLADAGVVPDLPADPGAQPSAQQSSGTDAVIP